MSTGRISAMLQFLAAYGLRNAVDDRQALFHMRR